MQAEPLLMNLLHLAGQLGTLGTLLKEPLALADQVMVTDVAASSLEKLLQSSDHLGMLVRDVVPLADVLFEIVEFPVGDRIRTIAPRLALWRAGRSRANQLPGPAAHSLQMGEEVGIEGFVWALGFSRVCDQRCDISAVDDPIVGN